MIIVTIIIIVIIVNVFVVVELVINGKRLLVTTELAR